MGYKEDFIKLMMEAGVMTFGQFTLKSGRSSPYFVNAGKYCMGSHISRLGDFYADAICESGVEFDVLYGPAYKGIPLCVAAASSLYRKYGRDLPYSFNRKEEKDHGEGGIIVGYTPKDGDRLAIIEDVTTAGTSIRDTAKLFENIAEVKIAALYVTIDRMERGKGTKSAFDELRDEFGVSIYPIVTVREVIEFLKTGVADSATIKAMEDYLMEYGAG